MPNLFPSQPNQGLAPAPAHGSADSHLLEQALPPPLADDRSADELEIHSIKWNVARIVRLSSGRYALLTHYRAGALDIIKVGTIEEITPYIPTAEQCIDDVPRVRNEKPVKKDVSDLLADIGL